MATIIITVTGCKEKTERVDAPPSTGEIVEKYVDTLVTAPDKAKDVVGAMGERTEAEEKALKELE